MRLTMTCMASAVPLYMLNANAEVLSKSVAETAVPETATSSTAADTQLETVLIVAQRETRKSKERLVLIYRWPTRRAAR